MQDPLYSVFGRRVRALREHRKVTQQELARRVDLSRTSITNIEKGRQRVLLHQVVQIANALDAKPGDLFPPSKPAHDKPLRADVAELVQALKIEAAT